jgi:WD40 repeat protein
MSFGLLLAVDDGPYASRQRIWSGLLAAGLFVLAVSPSMAVPPRLRATLKGHAGNAVASLAFSHDSSTLASGDSRVTINLWNVETEKNVLSLEAEGPVNSLMFSPDDKILVSGSGAVQVWDALLGKRKAIVEDETMCVALSPDGKLAASAGRDGTVRFWRVPSGREGPPSIVHEEDGMVVDVAFSPDGKTIASVGTSLVVKLWDVASGKNTATLEGHTKDIHCVAFGPDGKLLASLGNDRAIKLWETTTWKNTTTLMGDDDGFGFVFSPDGQTIAASEGPNVRLWDVATGKTTRLWAAADLLVTDVAFSPDGKVLATASDSIKLWEFPGDESDENELADERGGDRGEITATEIVSEDGTFRFAFPAKLPRKDLLSKPQAMFKGLPPIYAFNDGRMSYVMTVGEGGGPPQLVELDERAPDQTLRFVRDSTVKAFEEGKLLRQKNVEVKGGCGLEFTVSHPPQVFGRKGTDLFCVRVLHIGKRDYTMSAAGAASAFDKKKAAAFFDSFKTLKKAPEKRE